ncbi:S1 family peptidase [Streptomyces alboflavus]|uniref:S1 family peptidase n=1 Tax=Streptomyces alboflavus TaxID=67267 RepID=UPI000996BC86|nr:serine protease [Streptomyces alboflavus]
MHETSPARGRSLIRGRVLLGAGLLALTAGALGAPAGAAAASGPSPRPSGVHERIVDGEVVTEEKPWIASIGGEGHRCTATIIAERWALTAAHCVGPGDTPFLRIGSLDRTQGGFTAHGVRVIQHPDYNWPGYDAALIELDRDIETTYSPLAEADDVEQGQPAEVYGWGSERPDWGHPLPINLKYATGANIGTDCTPASPAVLCFGEGNGTTAGGDSGGPMRVQSRQTGEWVQAGISAVGPKPSGWWSGYTNIVEVRDWIRETAGV